MTDDLVKRLRITAGAGSLYPPYPQVINEAADRIEELEDRISWLEDKLAAVQYTNLRRDMNIKNRTIAIDTICKEKKNDPASTINSQN